MRASTQVISEIDSLLEKQAINLKNEEASALRQLKLRLSEVGGGGIESYYNFWFDMEVHEVFASLGSAGVSCTDEQDVSA